MVTPAWIRAAAVYADRRIVLILLLGFASGLPLALTGATLTVWLAEGGLTKASIGLFALVGLPYTLKFAWAPVIDRVRLPWLGRRFGRRRSWALATQAALMLALLAMSGTEPRLAPWTTGLFALLVAFCSASQDIVIDAYRVESLAPHQYGAGAATVVLGYRLGMLTSGAGALYLASALPWREVYAVMAMLVGVGMVTILCAPEPGTSGTEALLEQERQLARALVRRRGLFGWRARLVAWAYGAVIAPFADFMRHPAWLGILAFIVLFKLGEVYAGVMAMPFYLELGFTKPEIAGVTKVFGLIATITGGLIGGGMVGRLGVVRALLVTGLLQMVSNLCFTALAWAGHDLGMLMLTVAVENICGGMATAAFVAYLSGLCSVAYTATQYALLTSLAAFARDVLATGSGWCAESLGWVGYFLFSTALALPGLGLLLWLSARPPLPCAAAPAPAAGD
jgi:PAT family beta-lactamase induction signal transducer AmpG